MKKMNQLNQANPKQLSKIISSLLAIVSLILSCTDDKQKVVNFTEHKFKPTCI
jgi:hypothetical protein